ncbi:hypothetical protein LOK49_Contig285G00004 [Camellia lanceoleosa]|nr:hypothetical protein LOK49_Contig285G00004 [Camellia lanceoleosa]
MMKITRLSQCLLSIPLMHPFRSCFEVDEGASENGGDQNRREVHGTETERGGRSDEVVMVDARVEDEVANSNKDTSTSNKATEDEKKS